MVSLPRRIVRSYQIIHGREFPGFLIESLDCLAEEPRFWIDGDAGVLHHNPLLLVVFPDLPSSLLGQIQENEAVIIEEKHQSHFNDALCPWGMDRGGTGRTYEVPVVHVEDIGQIRDLFNMD